MSGDARVGKLSACALRLDLLSALVLVGLSVVALAWLIPTQISADAGQYDLSPAFFPTAGVWIVLVLASLLATVRAWELLRVSRLQNSEHAVQNKRTSMRAIGFEFVAWTLAGGVVFFALPIAGFLPTAIVIVVLGARICGRQDWLPGLVLGVGFCWLVQTATWSAFTVSLP